MKDIYKILRLGTRIKSQRIKLLGLWLLHISRKRYIGIFLDPVLGCNLRCKMCYFSDEKKRKDMQGILKYEEIETIGRSLFHRALKLQIGCGAEPTLHKNLVEIIALGKRYKIPYISLCTNGNLLTKELLTAAVNNGLNELTLSAHGFTKSTYESLMTNGKFESFRLLLANVAEIKEKYPQFKLRINYTINNDNFEELSQIWNVVGKELDILQLRPIQKIGESEYKDFDLTRIHARYDTVLTPLIEECHRRQITCIAPDKHNLIALKQDEVKDNSIEEATYCYVSPRYCWQNDFDYRKETFESYSKRHHLGRFFFKKVYEQKVNITRKMNYSIYK